MFAFLSIISNVIRCASDTVEHMEVENEVDEAHSDPTIIELKAKLNSYPDWLKNEWFEKTKEEIHEIISDNKREIVKLEFLANKARKQAGKNSNNSSLVNKYLDDNYKHLLEVEALREEIIKYTDFLKYRHRTPKAKLEAQIAEYKQTKMEFTVCRQTYAIVRCLFAD